MSMLDILQKMLCRLLLIKSISPQQQDKQEIAELGRQEAAEKFFTDIQNARNESHLQALKDEQTNLDEKTYQYDGTTWDHSNKIRQEI